MVIVYLHEYPLLRQALRDEMRRRKLVWSSVNPHYRQQMQQVFKEHFKVEKCKFIDDYSFKTTPKTVTWLNLRWK